jgi:hypothetical protein
MTLAGRSHWRIVFRKYKIFVGACVGVWTDETVDSYGLAETAKTIFIDDEVEGNYMKLLYIAVGIRAILFQIMTILTFASVIIAALAGSPLFVYSERLRKCLPAMIIWDSWERAIEKERVLTGRKRFDNVHWILYLRSISIRVADSRISCFFVNLLGICLSFVVLIYSEKTKPFVAFLLSLLFPFAMGKALIFIIFIGKSLSLTDQDFLRFFDGIACCCSFGTYRVKLLDIDEDAQDEIEEEMFHRQHYMMEEGGHEGDHMHGFDQQNRSKKILPSDDKGNDESSSSSSSSSESDSRVDSGKYSVHSYRSDPSDVQSEMDSSRTSSFYNRSRRMSLASLDSAAMISRPTSRDGYQMRKLSIPVLPTSTSVRMTDLSSGSDEDISRKIKRLNLISESEEVKQHSSGSSKHSRRSKGDRHSDRSSSSGYERRSESGSSRSYDRDRDSEKSSYSSERRKRSDSGSSRSTRSRSHSSRRSSHSSRSRSFSPPHSSRSVSPKSRTTMPPSAAPTAANGAYTYRPVNQKLGRPESPPARFERLSSFDELDYVGSRSSDNSSSRWSSRSSTSRPRSSARSSVHSSMSGSVRSSERTKSVASGKPVVTSALKNHPVQNLTKQAATPSQQPKSVVALNTPNTMASSAQHATPKILKPANGAKITVTTAQKAQPSPKAPSQPIVRPLNRGRAATTASPASTVAKKNPSPAPQRPIQQAPQQFSTSPVPTQVLPKAIPSPAPSEVRRLQLNRLNTKAPPKT